MPSDLKTEIQRLQDFVRTLYFPITGTLPRMEGCTNTDERDNSVSSASIESGNINTPSSTTAKTESPIESQFAFNSKPPTFATNNMLTSVPEPGSIYNIVDAESEKAMTFVGGEVTIVPHSEAMIMGGWQWVCQGNADGWIGFINVVSARYLGNNKKGFSVQSDKFGVGDKLKPMGISEPEEPTPKLIWAKNYDEAARWVFYEV
ncbi:hypothetical protein F4808DRAFT_463801 [Astrocystis sublimbata]|nr:hypothetical protein F4808DRAFT_463801 [Astrocystis sublimbata]